MKKMMLMAVVAGTFAFTSCSKDDEDGGENLSCATCSMSMEGMEVSSEYCDNGDGTYTMTVGGQEQTGDIPEGMTFDEFIEMQETIGMSCN